MEIEWLDKKGPDLPPFYQTQLAAGTPPDVVDLQGGIGIEYAAQGALLDLTPYLTAHPDVKARFNSDYLNNWVWDGKNWLVPFYVAKTLLFYNKPLFQKAGIAGQAANFDELLEQAAKIGAARRRPDRLSDAEFRLAVLGFVPHERYRTADAGSETARLQHANDDRSRSSA